MAYRIKESCITCPYESTHQILPHRMAQHIIKCRKNHPELDMRTCVFNATHVIPSKDYQAHILECPEKAIVERDIYRRQEIEDALEIKRRELVTMPSVSVCEEDWEQDCAGESYNSMETMISKEIARPPPPGLMGKSGRRAWRVAEIERVNRIKKGVPYHDIEYPDTSISGNTTTLPLNGSTSSLAISGSTSFFSGTSERDGDRSSLTASKCNLAMRADQPLRRPMVQKNSSDMVAKSTDSKIQRQRIAANIFNTPDIDSQIVGEISKKPDQCVGPKMTEWTPPPDVTSRELVCDTSTLTDQSVRPKTKEWAPPPEVNSCRGRGRGNQRGREGDQDTESVLASFLQEWKKQPVSESVMASLLQKWKKEMDSALENTERSCMTSSQNFEMRM